MGCPRARTSQRANPAISFQRRVPRLANT